MGTCKTCGNRIGVINRPRECIICRKPFCSFCREWVNVSSWWDPASARWKYASICSNKCALVFCRTFTKGIETHVGDYEITDTLEKYQSYFYQVMITHKLKPTNILEVGIGNGFASQRLRNMGYKVSTLDIDRSLRPDFIGDIRNLPFRDNSYDAVLCYQTLEHLPLGELPAAIAELRRVARRHLIISLPIHMINIALSIKLPLVKRKDILIRLPNPHRNILRQHYWELECGLRVKEFRKMVAQQNMVILHEVTPILDTYHYHFVIGKHGYQDTNYEYPMSS